MFINQAVHSIQPCLYFYSVNRLYCYENSPSSPCVFLKCRMPWYHSQHILGLIFIFIIHSQSLWSCIGLQLVLLLMALNLLISYLLIDQYLRAVITCLNQFPKYLQINTHYSISLCNLNCFNFSSVNYVEQILLFRWYLN